MRDGPAILVTAIGSMSADCVIRQLRLGIGGVRIVGCDLNPAEWLPAAAGVDAFHRVRSSHDAAGYLEDIARVCRDERITHLLPLTDPEVDLLSAEQPRWPGVTVCTPDAAAVATARDKLALAALFEGTGIAVIPTLEPRALPRSPALPLMFKPRRGRSSQGQFVARTAADLAYAREAFGSSHVAQPLLDGAVFVADVVRHAATGAVAVACREELLRTSNGAGMTVRTVADAALDAAAADVARAVGIHGCVNIEFLQVDGRYLLMDLNPRFSAGVAFSVLAGCDMVRAHWNCFQGIPPQPANILPGQIYVRPLSEQASRPYPHLHQNDHVAAQPQSDVLPG